ncbi:PREDICTED: interphotoreceptor matrix proteoglycan 2 [Nanorana parkeri]|uniref:interphotoreceptor matrix proteoglycan 2 n=1 Tax=Nanorana parkeri TaxID=125878 RepID=UPI000854E785|nr:PREDICTED: interphotoreceptor matrix proteoglycan 2 [Nanorana parkeri]
MNSRRKITALTRMSTKGWKTRTLLDGIVHKRSTDVQHGLEDGSGLLPESNPPLAESDSQQDKGFLKRKKRAILFPSGVKVCPEETFDQALVNHMKFFKLRVCQETVWEVFKIFWDRLPDQAEYQHWMHQCEEGTMPVFDIGENFSKSEDHHKLVKQKLALAKNPASSSDATSLTSTPETTTFRDAAANVPLSYAISVEHFSPTGFLKQEETEEQLDNEIFKITEKPARPVYKMVEFNMLILNEQYSPELSDVFTDQHKEFTGKFVTEMKSVYHALPGYKGIIVQKIRLAMEVQYAVIFDGDSDAINHATLDLMNLHSNKIEDTSLHDNEDNPTAVYTVSSFRNFILDSLNKQIYSGENTLNFDPDSLQLVNVKNVPSHIYKEWTLVTEKPTFPIPSTADVNNALQAEWLPTEFTTIRSTYPEEENNDELVPKTQVALEAESPVVTDDIVFKDNFYTSSVYKLTTPATALDFVQNTSLSSEESLIYLVATSVQSSDIQEESGDNDMSWYTHTTIGTSYPSVFEDISLPKEDNVITTTHLPPTATISSAVEYHSDIVTSAIAAEEPALSEPTLSSLLSYFESTKANGDNILSEVTEANSDHLSLPVTSVNSDSLLSQVTSANSDNLLSQVTSANSDNLLSQVTSESKLETAEILVEDNLLPTKLITENNIPLDEGSGSGYVGLTKEENPVTWSWTKTTMEPLSPLKGQSIDIDLMEVTRSYEDLIEENYTDKSVDQYISLPTTEVLPSLSQELEDIEISLSTIATEGITNQPVLLETVTNLPPVLSTPEYLNVKPSMQTPQPTVRNGHTVTEVDSHIDNSLEHLLSHTANTTSTAQPAEPPSTSIIVDYDTIITKSFISNKIEPVQPYIPVQNLSSVPTTNANNNQPITSSDKNIVLMPTTDITANNNDHNYLYFPSVPPSKPQDELSNTIPSLDIIKAHPESNSESVGESNIPNIVTVIHREEVISDPVQSESHPSGTSVGPTSLLVQDEGVTLDVQDISLELDHISTVYFHPDMSPEERSMVAKKMDSTDLSGVVFSTHESGMNVSSQRRALVVFFSLRVTNMIFSEDLFNKNSPEYKSLEQRFLELLVPYLQSNLTGFQNLEIMNFRNGSIIVNSRMKFAKPVPRNVTNAVYIILEDFCNTAYQTMNLAIDKYSLDVESGDVADPCKFQACNEYSECLINKWSSEGECVCNPGYVSVDGLPCQSICDLEIDFCQNDGKCDVIPGQGAICRCRVGENWWYRGEHCEEYVSEPLVVGIAIASVAGFLLVASAIIFFLARTLRVDSTKGDSEESGGPSDSLSSIENAVKYNPMYESDTTGYSHYYKRYPQLPSTSSTSPETSADFSSEEIRHIYENSELTKEEIQDRIRIIELYAKDRQFAEFVRQHQM